MNGYNVNFMTYGQTGTGKTYTLLGPAGSLKGCDGSTLPENCGILPRLAKHILENKGTSMLTLNCVQANYKVPVDILTKKSIIMDLKTHELIG